MIEDYYRLDHHTEQMFNDVISHLGNEFHSHEFINRLSEDYRGYFDRLQSERSGMRELHQYLGHVLSTNSESLHIEKITDEDGDDVKKKNDCIIEDGNGQLWRKILTIIMLMLFVPSCFAQLSITKATIPSSFIDGKWDEVMMDFDTNTISPISYKAEDGQIEVTVYNYDFSILRQFVIKAPEGRKNIGLCQFGYLGGRMDEPSFHFSLTKNLFTETGLIECLVEDNGKYWFIDENNRILGEFEGEIGKLIDPQLTRGKIVFDNGVMVDNEGSGIQSIYSNQSSSSISPNPTNGANSVAISWDYELLEDGELIVVDIDGKLIHTQSIKAGSRNATLSTGRFACGNYIYVVRAANGYTSTGKLIIN